jgi:formate/nitrite transporter FocA (FNT family)
MDPRTVFSQGLVCGAFTCAAIVSWMVGNNLWAGIFGFFAFLTMLAFIGAEPES